MRGKWMKVMQYHVQWWVLVLVMLNFQVLVMTLLLMKQKCFNLLCTCKCCLSHYTSQLHFQANENETFYLILHLMRLF